MEETIQGRKLYEEIRYFSYFSYFLAYREVMSNGQGSSPQAEAIQKKMDALMTRYLTMKAALLVQSAIDNSMLLCAASGSWMVQLALSLDQVCFQNGSQGFRNRIPRFWQIS